MEELALKSKTRAHHYLSQCYLKGFSGFDNQFIIPIDLENNRVLPLSNSKNFAQERDFNRVDLDGVSPNYLEDALGLEFEGKVATSIRNIENTGKFEGEDRIVILNLIALYAIRNPLRRNQYNNMVEQSHKMLLSMASQNIGRKVNGVLITKEFSRFLEDDKYKIIVSRNEHIRAELAIFNELLPYFLHRKWILIKACDDAEFITSDFPVVLLWTDTPKGKCSPGFGLRGTQVHFALSKKLALVGDFDGVDVNTIETKEKVALINTNILVHAKKWLFTSNADFYFLNKSGECLYGIDNYWNNSV